MPNETKSVFTFNKETLESKIVEIQTELKKFVGKANHNPFLWFKNNAEPLIVRLKNGETTQQLHDAVDALHKRIFHDKETPILDKNYKEPEPVKPTPVKPLGLKLPEK